MSVTVSSSQKPTNTGSEAQCYYDSIGVGIYPQRQTGRSTMLDARLLPALKTSVEQADSHSTNLSADRQAVLDQAVTFIAQSIAADETADLNFICTHNSRRSHLSHIWAHVAAWRYGLSSVRTFSGGTEATACNERTIAAFERAGFEIEVQRGEVSSTNPKYLVLFSASQPPISVFSKVYSDAPNPAAGFAAMMCCSDVDERCPVVQGAAARIPLHYLDPKASDGTEEESSVYDARSREIAGEMFYLMRSVSDNS